MVLFRRKSNNIILPSFFNFFSFITRISGVDNDHQHYRCSLPTSFSQIKSSVKSTINQEGCLPNSLSYLIKLTSCLFFTETFPYDEVTIYFLYYYLFLICTWVVFSFASWENYRVSQKYIGFFLFSFSVFIFICTYRSWTETQFSELE